ncbi:MAG: c-type cytochrome [Microscillaceae bacterium]|nr:c-type cytochrome [Microscillaceae bacterium]
MKIKYIAILAIIGVGLGAAFLMWAFKARKGKKVVFNYSEHRLEGVRFDKKDLGSAVSGQFTSLAIGPDGRLYANQLDGKIKRFTIKADGTLALDAEFKPFGSTTKALIGLVFDPSATATNLKIWISYCDFPELRFAPDWDGRIATLTLSPESNQILEQTLVLTNLPRSAKDHLTNGITFGKDSTLYISQGSNSPMGRASDNKDWAFRQESLLSGAVLRLDPRKLPTKLPLDVKTVDGQGKYDPFAPNAPLTIFATGLRNAYDLTWHSNGQLYLTVNGSSAGGNTPTSNPKDKFYIAPHPHYQDKKFTNAPAVTKVKNAQPDFLFRIEEGGYYGHPNPLRAEYVLNRGAKDIKNPEYQNQQPDLNFRKPAFEFGLHASPNGIIEYKSQAFNGQLSGKLLVVRFNGYNDVMALEPGGDEQNIYRHYDGKFMGMDNLDAPLDLIEDPKTGNLYVSEFGGYGKITLFKPSLNPNQEIKKPNPIADKAKELDENTLTVSTKPADIEAGKQMYLKNCAVCHGQAGEGDMGPNLADEYWLYGADIKVVFRTIKNGANNGMQAWSNKFVDEDIRKIASFVLSLKGSNPPNAKEPEGKLYGVTKAQVNSSRP